jgi:flagellar hook-length control protein FliK
LTPELPAQLAGDDDAVPVQGSGGRARAKTDTTPIAAAAPATDIASLIGAAAAAGQAALNPRYATPPISNPAPVSAPGVKLDVAANKLTATPEPITAATSPAPAAAPVFAAPTGHAAMTAEADKATLANASGAAADPALSAGLQAASRNDTLPAVAQLHADRDTISFVSQSAAMQSVATPAASPPPTPATPMVSASIATPVGAQGWDQALGQHVVWMVAQRNPTAEIHVNPPNLGPLSITVNVTDNTASATFVAAHAATRDAIADAMPHLKNMLADSGISLGQVTVSAESFAQNGGSGAGQSGYAARNTGSAAAGRAAAAGVSGLISPVRTSQTLQGLVDTFA